jgi:hypothetical protein
VPDIKAIRDAIQTVADNKVNASGRKITSNPINIENADVEFGVGRKARAAQINETINNIEILWQTIKKQSSGLGPKAIGDRMRKQDYKDVLQKTNDLAGLNQTPESGYINHFNSGCNHWVTGGAIGSYSNHTNSEGGYINHINAEESP